MPGVTKVPEVTAAKVSRVMSDPVLKAQLQALLAGTDVDGDGKADIRGVKNLWMKDGSFSSTKLFASVASILVLVVSTVTMLFAGAQVDLSFVKFAVPEFNAEWAMLIGGLFQANNQVDSRLKHIARKEKVVRG